MAKGRSGRAPLSYPEASAPETREGSFLHLGGEFADRSLNLRRIARRIEVGDKKPSRRSRSGETRLAVLNYEEGQEAALACANCRIGYCSICSGDLRRGTFFFRKKKNTRALFEAGENRAVRSSEDACRFNICGRLNDMEHVDGSVYLTSRCICKEHEVSSRSGEKRERESDKTDSSRNLTVREIVA